MVTDELIRLLACPLCKNDIEYDKENEKITCPVCRLKYPIQDDIPVMLVDKAEKY